MNAAVDRVIGGYRITGVLGEGGMASVYEAEQVSIGRKVALKIMSSALAEDSVSAERFMREARAVGQINDPHVITIFDVGCEDGKYYMALELLQGGDVRHYIEAAGGKISPQRAIEIFSDMVHGLTAIEDVGLLHRDIKPANIFLTTDGRAKLADLGLARSTMGDDRMTMTGQTVGTPAFMSPEQARGNAELDIRSDIYSLGATLYYMVCGRPPFKYKRLGCYWSSYWKVGIQIQETLMSAMISPSS